MWGKSWESRRKSPWHFKEVSGYTLSVMNNRISYSALSCSHFNSTSFFFLASFSPPRHPNMMAARGDLIATYWLDISSFPSLMFSKVTSSLPGYLANAGWWGAKPFPCFFFHSPDICPFCHLLYCIKQRMTLWYKFPSRKQKRMWLLAYSWSDGWGFSSV